MNVYRADMDKGPAGAYDGNDVYCRLMVESDADRKVLDAFESFRGQPVDLKQWKPFKVIRAYTTPDNLTKPLGDRAGVDFRSDPVVLSRRALDELLPYIGRFGQMLPLAFDECEYSLFNITNVVDALDEAASEVWRFPSSGRIGDIKRYVFKPEAVRDQWIFKIPQRSKGFAFVTDRFVEAVQQAGLTGFGFELLWSDEKAPAARAA
jgi:hypothetical protein